MNYYERHLGDYAKDTCHLSLIEHGAYCLLLDRYYSTESGISVELVYRVARAKTKDEKAAVDFVLSEFFSLENGMWFNKRADEEIIKAQKKIHAAKMNGSKGGRPQKTQKTVINQQNEKPNGLLLGSENETQQKAHQTPVHHLKEPPIPPKGGNAGSKSQAIALKTYLAECKAKGEKAIPEDDPVFVFADKAGIPDEWLRIVWREFVERYSDGSKRYKDWRKHFRNAVRGNWFKVWYCDEGGRMFLSSQGRVLDIANLEAA